MRAEDGNAVGAVAQSACYVLGNPSIVLLEYVAATAFRAIAIQAKNRKK
jgi:hypothetical protein